MCEVGEEKGIDKAFRRNHLLKSVDYIDGKYFLVVSKSGLCNLFPFCSAIAAVHTVFGLMSCASVMMFSVAE